MLRATIRLFCPRAGARREQAPFSRLGGGKLAAQAPRTAPARGAARRPGAFPRSSGLGRSRPGSGAPGPATAPRSRRNKSERSAADPGGRAQGPARGARGSPNARHIRLRGAGAGDPHPLPKLWLGAGGDAPRSPRPLLRWLDLARVLKAGLAAPGRPGAEFRCRLRSGGGGSLPPLPLMPPLLRGSHRNEKASGL